MLHSLHITFGQAIGYGTIIATMLSLIVWSKYEAWKEKRERSKWNIWTNGKKRPIIK